MIKKNIILFGTGSYFENYMTCCGAGHRPLFAVDNKKEVWGTEKCGVKICSPEALLERDKDSYYVVICDHEKDIIEKQLEKMGISDHQYYVPIPMETATPMELDLESGKVAPSARRAKDSEGAVYGIGYVPGVFDLFHVGHLNLLRNSKSRCEYLIAGVLTDELVEYFKHKPPVIPYEQRAAIIGAVEYVDRVVPVDFSNTRKIDAWHRYHYDCHFSGNDHGTDWKADLKKLKEVGSNMEFFEYTKATSSTAIKGKMS